MAAGGPDEPANMRGTCPARGAVGRAQRDPDEPTAAVEDHGGLKVIFRVMGIEQALPPMPVDGESANPDNS